MNTATKNKAFEAFVNIVESALSVPRSVIEERDRHYKDASNKNPRKRGPKKSKKQKKP